MGLCWFWQWTLQVPWFGIMIADAYQGMGLGRSMTEFAIAEARDRGKGGILLTTAKTNVRSQTLYGRCGFETLGEATNGEYLLMINFPDRRATAQQ